MVRNGREEWGERLHGKQSCRRLADTRGDFRDEEWGQFLASGNA
jgi:hypothetical protein